MQQPTFPPAGRQRCLGSRWWPRPRSCWSRWRAPAAPPPLGLGSAGRGEGGGMCVSAGCLRPPGSAVAGGNSIGCQCWHPERQESPQPPQRCGPSQPPSAHLQAQAGVPGHAREGDLEQEGRQRQVQAPGQQGGVAVDVGQLLRREGNGAVDLFLEGDEGGRDRRQAAWAAAGWLAGLGRAAGPGPEETAAALGQPPALTPWNWLRKAPAPDRRQARYTRLARSGPGCLPVCMLRPAFALPEPSDRTSHPGG
jgi:hypothetical protein